MSESVHNIELIKSIFLTEEEYVDLAYVSEGEVLTFEEAEMPEGWTFTVVDVNTEMDYDSYGYGSANGYVVFSASDGVDTVLYKIPGGYASYEGWTWDYRDITSTERTQKVVTTWEWSN